MSGSRYTPDHAGMDEFLNSDILLRVVEDRARAIKTYAEATAPVGLVNDPHPGRYKASFTMRSHTHGGAKNDRAEAIVSNIAPEAIFVEFGTHGREPYHTLLRAAVEGGRIA